MKTVLVTGANGFLASHLIPRLLAAGYKVRGLLRNIHKYRGEMHPNLFLWQGDITDPRELRAAIRGCDAVIDVAAITFQGASREEYRRVNIEAVENMLEICVGERIEKFVFVGSANAFAYGDEANLGDETAPYIPPFTRSLYAWSKYEAQRAVLGYADRLDVTVVNPTFMIGRSCGASGSERIIARGLGKRVVFCPRGGKNFVDVDDAACGTVAALEKGARGECYLLAGENLSYREFYRLLAEATHSRSRIFTIPSILLVAAGAVGSLLSRLGLRSEVNLANMRILCVRNYYTNAKSVRELGVEYRKIADSLKSAIE